MLIFILIDAQYSQNHPNIVHYFLTQVRETPKILGEKEQ